MYFLLFILFFVFFLLVGYLDANLVNPLAKDDAAHSADPREDCQRIHSELYSFLSISLITYLCIYLNRWYK